MFQQPFGYWHQCKYLGDRTTCRYGTVGAWVGQIEWLGDDACDEMLLSYLCFFGGGINDDLKW